MRPHSCRNRNFLHSHPLDVARVKRVFNIRNILRDKNPGKLRLRFFCISRSRLHLWPFYNQGLRIPLRIEQISQIMQNTFRLGRDIEIITVFSPFRKKKIGRTKQRRKSQTKLSAVAFSDVQPASSSNQSLSSDWYPDRRWGGSRSRGALAGKAAKFIPRRSIDFGLYCLKTWIIFMGATLWFQYSRRSVVRRRSRKITAILWSGAINPGTRSRNIIELVAAACSSRDYQCASRSYIYPSLYVAISRIDSCRWEGGCRREQSAVPRQWSAVKPTTRNEWVTKNASPQLCFMALMHQIYVYANEYLLVKSTSFGPIVHDSNTIIVRFCMLPPLPSLILSPAQSFITSFIIHFTRKCGQSLLFEKLFLAYSLIAPRIHHVYSPKDLSFMLRWWRYRIALHWIQHLIIAERARTIKKGLFETALPQCRKSWVVTLLSWKYIGHYKNTLKL